MKDWRNLRNKKVVVRSGGIVYRGTVVELGEGSLVLRGITGFQEIAWDRITAIEEERVAPGVASALRRDGADRPDPTDPNA